MSDPVWLALIGSAQVVALAIIAARNHGETKRGIRAVDAKVEETRVAIDGRMEQLVTASRAQGAQDQRAETRQDAKDERAADACRYPDRPSDKT